MKNNKLQKGTGIKIYTIVALLGWTVFVAVVLSVNIYYHELGILEIARNHAQSSFERDLVLRRWAAKRGGVYAPLTEDTPPNPYLSHIIERVIKTPSGRQLTLMNPAYITRQIHELGEEQYGLRGHITSLNPLRPENTPDSWEQETLKGFEKHPVEVTSLEEINGQPCMRLMKPMITEQSCLKCQASQGYNIGDIRGGVSVSVPIEPIRAIANFNLKKILLGYSTIWILGLIGICIAAKKTSNYITKYRQAELTYRSLYEASSDAVMLLDEKGFFGCNDSTVRLFGCQDKSEFISKHPSEVSPATQPCGGDSLALANEQIATAMEKGSSHFEWIHQTIDGIEFPSDVLLSAMELNGKKILQAVVRDISERKRADKEMKDIARFPSENPNPVLRISKDGEVLYSNEAGIPLLNKWKSDVGKKVPEEWYNFIIDTLASGKGMNEEEEVDCKTFVITIAPIVEAGYANLYARDITELKSNEEYLQKTLADLEHFNKLMTGREERVIEMKKEVNALLAELDREPQYLSVLDANESVDSFDKVI